MFFYNNPYVSANFTPRLPQHQDGDEVIYDDHDADWDYKRPKYKSKKYKDWSLDMNKDRMFYYDFFYKKGENSILEDANNGIDPLKVSVKNFDKFISLLKGFKFPFTIKDEKNTK